MQSEDFGPWAWGRGLATEAASAVLDPGVHSHGLTEIFSFTSAANLRSEAVMLRIGMVRRPGIE
jgi:RimJ/RimL family protein N-acetyltransferase